MTSNNLTHPDYIVVEGPIGVGKTSLVRRLAESFKAETLLELAEENPFLERFYTEGKPASFPTQLFFLFQRSRQLETLRQSDMFRSSLVSDFMQDKDRLFAEINLDAEELKLYKQVHERLPMEAPTPNLVVYLQASSEVLMERIRRRNRPQESGISADYLRRLCDAYTEYFFRYDKSPLLIINATDINPVERESDYQLLLEQIKSVRSGKHYFNPTPILL